VFNLVYPDWKTSNQDYVRSLCEGEEKGDVLVVKKDGALIGFISYFLKPEKKGGEIGINAVHPEYQKRGIGTAMYEHVLKRMEEEGIELVEVGTGGDPSHRAARRAYEKCGFVSLPLVRYYKSL
jgi:GNAT superfamily N-acetyltransferase